VFWLTTCPNCHHQGRLVVMHDQTRDRLYLHCEECESGWRDPDKVGDPSTRFLTLTEEFEAEPATAEDIRRHGWTTYPLQWMNENS
jgi:hypothetical protein